MKNAKAYNFLQIEVEEDDKGSMLKAFGKNLRKLRIAGGLTQEQLGELAKVNYKYIGEIERGEKNPTAIVIYRLSQALKVNVSEILAIDDYPGTTANVIKEVERLFAGKKKKDIQKAIRILEVFFE